MLHFREESFVEYGSSCLGCYHFVNHEIFYLPSPLYFSLYPMCNVECDKLFGMNFIIFVLSKFRNNLFAANGLIICKGTKFDIDQKSSKFLLEIMTLVSSANNICSDIEFLHRGCSLTYIMNNRVPRIDPWGTPYLNVPQSERKKIFSCVRRFCFNVLHPLN
jgi:hypothetical protein